MDKLKLHLTLPISSKMFILMETFSQIKLLFTVKILWPMPHLPITTNNKFHHLLPLESIPLNSTIWIAIIMNSDALKFNIMSVEKTYND